MATYFSPKGVTLIAPLVQRDFGSELKGLRRPSAGSLQPPVSRRGHAGRYILPSLSAGVIAIVIDFLILLTIEVQHFDEKPEARGYSGAVFWLTALVLSIPFMMAVWAHAWVAMSRVSKLQARLGCTYTDAFFVNNTLQLRRIANTLATSEDLQELISQARAHHEMCDYLVFLNATQKLLAPLKGEHAAQLKEYLKNDLAFIKDRI